MSEGVSAAFDDDVLQTAWKLVAEDGWRELSFVELAARTGKPLPDIYVRFPTRRHLLFELGKRADREMLAVDRSELAELSPRERLFELLMRRFDALLPFREGLRRAGREAGFDPGLLMLASCNIDRMTRWALDAAGVRMNEPLATAGRQALALAYASVFRVWLQDETEDRSRTLAELDKRLQQLDRLASFAWRFGGRPERPAAPGEGPAMATP